MIVIPEREVDWTGIETVSPSGTTLMYGATWDETKTKELCAMSQYLLCVTQTLLTCYTIQPRRWTPRIPPPSRRQRRPMCGFFVWSNSGICVPIICVFEPNYSIFTFHLHAAFEFEFDDV
ncbi:hypothetical protein EIP91_005864 [Steccherinum ochraceum]|uniref:Uncharacterized protein n=1 Tax=Steccherinum ochraceum TaxID=92696 RepID=A0A4V2MVS3_9APHY|nr:hypothetical protein EIP91_005864 [Steccherinum ochraceum]